MSEGDNRQDAYDRDDVAVLLKVVAALIPVLDRLVGLLPPGPQTDALRETLVEAQRELER